MTSNCTDIDPGFMGLCSGIFIGVQLESIATHGGLSSDNLCEIRRIRVLLAFEYLVNLFEGLAFGFDPCENLRSSALAEENKLSSRSR